MVEWTEGWGVRVEGGGAVKEVLSLAQVEVEQGAGEQVLSTHHLLHLRLEVLGDMVV